MLSVDTEFEFTLDGRMWLVGVDYQVKCTHYAPACGPSWTSPGDPEEFEWKLTGTSLVYAYECEDEVDFVRDPYVYMQLLCHVRKMDAFTREAAERAYEER